MKKKIILLCMIFSCFFAINCFASVSLNYEYEGQNYNLKFDIDSSYSHYVVYKIGSSSVRYGFMFSQTDFYVKGTNFKGDNIKFVEIPSASMPLTDTTDITLTSSSYYSQTASFHTFIASSHDIYNIDNDTLVFQKPLVQKERTLEEVLVEEPQQIQGKIWETLKTIVPIAILVFSMLLLVLLIRYHLL